MKYNLATPHQQQTSTTTESSLCIYINANYHDIESNFWHTKFDQGPLLFSQLPKHTFLGPFLFRNNPERRRSRHNLKGLALIEVQNTTEAQNTLSTKIIKSLRNGDGNSCDANLWEMDPYIYIYIHIYQRKLKLGWKQYLNDESF